MFNCSIILYLLLLFLPYLSILQSTASINVNSSKYTSVDSSTGGIELKDKPKSFVDPDVSEVKTTLDDDDDDEPTKEAVA